MDSIRAVPRYSAENEALRQQLQAQMDEISLHFRRRMEPILRALARIEAETPRDYVVVLPEDPTKLLGVGPTYEGTAEWSTSTL